MRPIRVVDDGKKTYLQMTPNAAPRELPALVIVGPKGPEMVNYRVKGDMYIVDRLFERGALILGRGQTGAEGGDHPGHLPRQGQRRSLRQGGGQAMNDIDSPTGIDLRPEPPNPVRLSKRAGLIALVVVTAVVGLVGYGIATRRQRTAAAMERADPTRLTAASDAGKVIAAEIPARMITAGMTATPDKQELQVPEQPGRIPPSARVLHKCAHTRLRYKPNPFAS